eukprot:13572292-Alexandrium_andersonii.AAC.1
MVCYSPLLFPCGKWGYVPPIRVLASTPILDMRICVAACAGRVLHFRKANDACGTPRLASHVRRALLCCPWVCYSERVGKCRGTCVWLMSGFWAKHVLACGCHGHDLSHARFVRATVHVRASL